MKHVWLADPMKSRTEAIVLFVICYDSVQDRPPHTEILHSGCAGHGLGLFSNKGLVMVAKL